MRAKYLILPLAAFGLWFACGKLSKTRNDKSSGEKTTESGTGTDTDTGTDDSGQVVLAANDDCLSLGKIEDDATYDRYRELNCGEKATYCDSDDECAYGGAGGCSGPTPVGKKLESLVASARDWAGRGADCDEPFTLKTAVTSLCKEHSCQGKATYKKKDGSASDCVFGKGSDCDQLYLCESVYFGEDAVDVREFATTDDKCPTRTVVLEDQGCYEIPAGNTATPQPTTYQWMTPRAACRMFDSAAAN